MAVVTISRLYGVGGRAFGRDLAGALGWGYLDKELLASVAERAGASEGTVELYEGLPPGPAKRLADLMLRRYPGARAEIMDPERYADVLRATVSEVAEAGRVVIVGRGGQCILAGDPRALHLRLVADRAYIVTRLGAEPGGAGVPEEELWRRSEAQREGRRDFARRHFGVDLEDPLLYHLVMNLGKLPRDEALRVVVDMVRRREGGTAG